MCPLTGDDCMKHECEWYTHVIGSNPQTGKHIDNFGCAVTFLPLLLIENSQQQRQTGAAVESFRNRVLGARPVPKHNEDTKEIKHEN